MKWGGNKYMFFWERDGGDPRIMMQFGAEKKRRDEAQRSRSPCDLGYGFADFETCEAIAMERSSENVFQTTFVLGEAAQRVTLRQSLSK